MHIKTSIEHPFGGAGSREFGPSSIFVPAGCFLSIGHFQCLLHGC